MKASMRGNKFTLEKGIMYMSMECSNHHGVQIERRVNGHIFLAIDVQIVDDIQYYARQTNNSRRWGTGGFVSHM
jgi:hypothetical protein